jgi:hypothetical protein
MGELDLTVVHPDPGLMLGTRYAFLTVFFTWLPLAIAGIVLVRTRMVHATMRGAGPLRALAHLAIAVQVGAVVFPLLILAGSLASMWGRHLSWLDVFLVVVIGASIVLPIAAISAAGIVAWHRVLVALASREGEGRMLV